jgi:hypothetical protein
MTVQQLIDKLQQQDPEAQVHFLYNSGDHWRTVLAPKVANVDEGSVTHSDYHGKPVLVDVDSDDEDEANEPVVVLS